MDNRLAVFTSLLSLTVAAELTYPWQTRCYECITADSDEAYGVVELLSDFQYGFTEEQCLNLAASLDENYTLNSDLSSNFYYTYAGRDHTFSSCAVAIASSCHEQTDELMKSNQQSDSVTLDLSAQDGACASNSSQYFIDRTTQALANITGDILNFYQVEERLDSGSLQLTDDLSILFGGSAARRRLQTPLSFNCGAPGLLQFYKWYGCIAQQAGPQLCEAAPELLRNILRGLGGLCT